MHMLKPNLRTMAVDPPTLISNYMCVSQRQIPTSDQPETNIPVSEAESVCTRHRVQELLLKSQPDPSMAGALPPGAWWEAKPSSSSANGSQPPEVDQPALMP